jgi:hypothetical protein
MIPILLYEFHTGLNAKRQAHVASSPHGRLKHPWKCNLFCFNMPWELLQYVLGNDNPGVMMPESSLRLT